MIELKGRDLLRQKIQKRNTLKKLKNQNYLQFNWTDLQIFRTAFYYVCTIYWPWWKWLEGRHFKCFWITYAHYQQWNFQSFKWINWREGLDWKNCVGVCIDGAACLTGRNLGLGTKTRDMAGNNLFSTLCYIHRQNLTSKKWHLNLMKSCLSLLKLLII